eukprot:8491819-Pyramimonas_sp.AAC.1
MASRLRRYKLGAPGQDADGRPTGQGVECHRPPPPSRGWRASRQAIGVGVDLREKFCSDEINS